MSLKDKIYLKNFYVNNSIKFYCKPKKVRDLFVAGVEFVKIILAKLNLLEWSFKERVLERPFVFQNLPKNKNAKILDVGCSDSIMPIEIASLGYETYGNDPRAYPFKHPNLKFIQADGLNLDFPDNYFDAITCISVIEHVGLNMDYGSKAEGRKDKMLMKKMKKMIKKKGKIILTTSLAGKAKILENGHTRIYSKKELDWLISDLKKMEERYFYKNGEHFIEINPSSIQNLINDNPNLEILVMFLLKK
ncbi:MAG: class I SAM-dependent methyltransferase [Nanoarchaeota archaeon]|nr:class I SAM-dependent methyltransferase [Nanoarchaeota archaeon]